MNMETKIEFTKNLCAAGCVVLIFYLNAFAKLDIVPLDKLVKDSDLIIIGTLTKISERSEDFVIDGKGEIVIEKVIAGEVKTSKGFALKSGDKLPLKYAETFACVYGSHRRIENEKGIFFLTFNDKEEVQYETFHSLDSLPEVKKLLQRGIEPSKISKTIRTQNDAGRTELSSSPELTKNRKTAANLSAIKSSEADAKKYYPVQAFLVVLISMLFYWFLYRSRFKIR